MLNRRTQVVIAIGILILALAFFLVGLNFASLQGLFFQNGAASMQMFANDVGAAQNAIYSAPSSMSVTLSGNTSLCQWVPAIDAYTCAGGSKIYNISYAAGPTLDVGKNVFSFDLCIMVGILPSKASFSKVYDFFFGPSDAEAAATEEITSLFKSAGAEPEQTQEAVTRILSDLRDTNQNFDSLSAKTAARLARKAVRSDSEYQDLLNTRTADLFESLDKAQDADYAAGLLEDSVDSGTAAVNSIGSFLANGLRGMAKAAATNVLISTASFLAGYASPYFYYWFSTDANTASKMVTPANPAFARFGLQPLKSFTTSQSDSVLASYEELAPIQSTGNALNFELQKFVQTASNIQAVDSLPSSIAKDNLLYEFGQAIGTGKDILDELASYNLNQNNTSPYYTPVEGVSTPSTLNSSSNNFISSVNLNGIPAGNGDPLLQDIGFYGSTAVLVGARTAVCLGDLQYAFSKTGYSSSTSALGSVGSIIGAVSSLVNFYTRINLVSNTGTNFVGYGGEVYLNGEANGKPQEVSVPVIVDMQDICSIAQNTYKQGVHLQSMVQPSGNGSISFSLNQGMVNTLCAEGDNLFPQPLSSFVNNVISAPSGSLVSILLPPKYAVGFLGNTNSNGLSYDTSLCLFNVIVEDTGIPLVYQAKGSYTEFGTMSSCINISNMSGGKYSINLDNSNINNNNPKSAGDSALASGNEFYLNNNFSIGFSTPIGDYPSDGNFILGPKPNFVVQSGVDSPLVNVIAAARHHSALRAQLPSNLNPLQYVLSAFTSWLYPPTPYQGFYETEYSNITFEVSRNGNTITLTPYNESLVFGVFPNSVTDLGGSYTR
ncbi:MAG: hypothetical protein ACP5RE_02600 [Candidatus Acidifodinimicrobium sp.]